MSDLLISLTVRDLNYSRQEPCAEGHDSGFGTCACLRPKGHLGEHASLFEGMNRSWTYCVWGEEGGYVTPGAPLWLERECGECGLPLVRHQSESVYCHKCSYWLTCSQRFERGEEDLLIYQGFCYELAKPEDGDYRDCETLLLEGGASRRVGLWAMGLIPSHFRYFLPDNCVLDLDL